MIETLAYGVVAVVALILAFWLFILVPRNMALARGRGPVAWVVISLLLSPFLAILLLLLLGPKTS